MMEVPAATVGVQVKEEPEMLSTSALESQVSKMLIISVVEKGLTMHLRKGW